MNVELLGITCHSSFRDPTPSLDLCERLYAMVTHTQVPGTHPMMNGECQRMTKALPLHSFTVLAGEELPLEHTLTLSGSRRHDGICFLLESRCHTISAAEQQGLPPCRTPQVQIPFKFFFFYS